MNLTNKVTISYYAEGARNALGEPSRTLTARDEDVPCSLQARSPKVQFEYTTINRARDQQGTSFIPTKVLIVKRSQTLNDGDIITDADDNTFIVARVESIGRSHKEAILATEP